MTKKRTTITLDPENKEYLDDPSVNTSGLINRLVEQYRQGGVDQDLIRKYDVQRLQSEVEEHRAMMEVKEEQLANLQEKLEAREEILEDEVESALDDLYDTPRDAENPAIQNRARKCNIRPEELVARLLERYGELDEYGNPTKGDDR